MDFTPVTGVWEITMGCNMRCKHCGSSCTSPLEDELTTEEALALCDDIADLGLKWITLSGGEPLTRRDWPQLVERLRCKGVIPNIITNGWMCDEKAVLRAKEAGVGTFAISLDGLPDTHDYMRKQGSFERTARAFQLMAENDISSGAITTVSTKNMPELPALKEKLLELGVRYWQLQIGLPMGNFEQTPQMIMSPEDVDQVIDFIYSAADDDRITIYPADCIGYYSHKELASRQKAHKAASPPVWRGCNAGKRSFGILHNGEILGCTSIRNREFIEGSIRERPLREIWEDEKSFLWSRTLKKEELEGQCKTCQYGDLCLGGCPNTRLTMTGRIHSENAFCSYNVALKKTQRIIGPIDSVAELLQTARNLVMKGEFQLAALSLERALEIEPENIDVLQLYGYVSFSLNNLKECRDANQQVLKIDTDNVYANKGMGLALHRLGDSDVGIRYLQKAVALAPEGDRDPYNDLAAVYMETGQQDKAEALLKEANLL
ncbi:MAG: radical SAM protein [Candidatus Electrothrix scaldis]|nr:MAG: radical SAM protein [Candidatus Electrothrix sp. GW3-3]